MLFSKRSHEGYLMVDHQASPGLTAEQARAMGYSPQDVPAGALSEGRIFEAPILICAHCPTSMIINPARTRARAYCPKCDQYICDRCEAERHQPGYLHVSMQMRKDLAMAGAL